ncbi:MAG: apolipoprotein N-acyltransferase, partial [Moraxella osloensis]|nr:apolipoprotein N-acyltransferase [Moraxella osloensis]
MLTLPFLWVMMEWLRLWIFNGFPWLILGYSQIDSALAGYAPVLGVEGLSWLTAITAGLLIWLLKNSFSAPGLVMLVAIWVGGMLLGMVQWTTPLGDKLQVALVQGNWAQKDKWLPQYTLRTLREYQKEINRYWNADLIVLPETALPIVWQDLGDFFSNTQNRAVLEQKDVLVGTVTRQDDGGYFNSVINLRNGDDYHKHHLVPFGEYTPWPWLFSPLAQLLNIPLSDFSHPPVGQPLVLNNGLAAGLSICYEIAFQSQQQAYMPQASLLVTLSNDAWFDRSLEPEQHLQMARMRALELGRPLARATNTGATALIDEKGQLVTR